MIWIRLVLLAAMAFGLWRLLRTKWAFTVIVDETGVRSHEGIKTPQQRRLLELFRKTRFVEGRVKIFGRSDENGQLQLKFQGNLSDQARQQIRNFITNEL